MAVSRSVIEVTSAAVAKRNGRWRMRDRGEWNSRGELVLLGRQGPEINIGGKKVHPSEVEQALRSIPGVSDAIIWGDSHSDRSFLHAVVETRLPLMSIQRALSTKLPDWKLPKHYVTMAELPRNARGKVDLAALRQSNSFNV